jgi:hypothetical protein
MERKDIIQELNGLGSNLPADLSQNIYAVPADYFEGFASQVIARIQAEAYISSLPNENPYHVPAGYFDGLQDRIISFIRNHPDYQTSQEELESISPLLSGLNKKPVYSVPENYFEQLDIKTPQPEVKVISIAKRSWFKYAAAAVVVGMIVTSSLLIFNSGAKADPKTNPYGWVKDKMKKVDKDDISEFVQMAEPETALKENGAVGVKPGEIKELMKDVSSSEIDKFLTETATIADGNGEDALMN